MSKDGIETSKDVLYQSAAFRLCIYDKHTHSQGVLCNYVDLDEQSDLQAFVSSELTFR